MLDQRARQLSGSQLPIVVERPHGVRWFPLGKAASPSEEPLPPPK